MGSVVNVLKDPVWWFTAVFIGILASLIASYIRDSISWLTSRISSTLRLRREKRLEHEQQRIELLAAFPDLLTMELIRTAVGLGFFIAAFISYLAMPSFINSIEHLPELRRFEIFDFGITRNILTYLTLLTGILAIYAGVTTNYRSEVVFKARSLSDLKQDPPSAFC